MQTCIMIQVVKSRLTAFVMLAKKEFATATLISTGGSGLFSAGDGRYSRAASYNYAATNPGLAGMYFSSKLPACSSGIQHARSSHWQSAHRVFLCQGCQVLARSIGPLRGHHPGLTGIVLQQQDPCMQAQAI